MAFVTDTMTDTAGVALTSHTGETGATWTTHTGKPAAASVISDANRVRPNEGTSGYAYASGAPAGAEYDVSADVVPKSTGTDSRVGVAGRIATGAATAYHVRYHDSNGQWELYAQVAGSFTQLGTYSQAVVANTTYALKLQIRDAAKKVFIDTVERISSADNGITAAGKAGVWLEGVTSNTTGWHLDNVSAVDAAGGGGGVLYTQLERGSRGVVRGTFGGGL